MISVSDLSKTYYTGFFRRPFQALESVSFTVEPGEVFGLVGDNGAGKSTLIRLMLGLIRPSAGAVKLRDLPAENPSSRKSLGYVPESPYYYRFLTGREFLSTMASLSGISGSGLKGELSRVTGELQIREEWLAKKLQSYSKGMLQRIGIAQALLGKPDIIILDEPSSGLDPSGRKLFIELMQRLKNEGVTLFYSSHILHEVKALCDRVAFLQEGRLLEVLPAENLSEKDFLPDKMSRKPSEPGL